MCTPLPAQVISMEIGTALVTSGGPPVRVSRPPRLDIEPGDWVLVYLGQIVGRVEPEEASALQELLQAIDVPWGGPGRATASPEFGS